MSYEWVDSDMATRVRQKRIGPVWFDEKVGVPQRLPCTWSLHVPGVSMCLESPCTWSLHVPGVYEEVTWGVMGCPKHPT